MKGSKDSPLGDRKMVSLRRLARFPLQTNLMKREGAD